MIENEVPVRIHRMEFKLSIAGLTELEISTIAKIVTEKMEELEAATKTADTARLAALAAMNFAAELYLLKQQSEDHKRANERRVTDMISTLNSALGKELL